jgi:hypothetical protein
MSLQRVPFKQLLVFAGVMLWPSACSTQTKGGGMTDAWAGRVVSGYYDARQEADASIARMGDSTGMAYVLNSLRAAFDAARNERNATMERLTFLTRYRPIWKGDKVITAEWDRRAARIKYVSDEVTKQWTPALEAAHGSSIAEVWIVGFLIDMDSLFTESGLNARRSAVLFGRLKALPKSAIDPLAKALNAGAAWAAELLIQNDDLFDQSGAMGQAQFESAMKLLTGRLPAAQ